MSLLWNRVSNEGMSYSETQSPFIFKYLTMYFIYTLNLVSIFLNHLTLARILITSSWVIVMINFGRWANELLRFRILSIGNSIMTSFNMMLKNLSYLNHYRRNSTTWNRLQGENMSACADSRLLLLVIYGFVTIYSVYILWPFHFSIIICLVSILCCYFCICLISLTTEPKLFKAWLSVQCLNLSSYRQWSRLSVSMGMCPLGYNIMIYIWYNFTIKLEKTICFHYFRVFTGFPIFS